MIDKSNFDFRSKPFSRVLKSIIVGLATAFVLVICIYKFDANPQGLSIAAFCVIALFASVPMEEISIGVGELLYEKKWIFGLYKDSQHVYFGEIESVSIFGQNIGWFSDLIELRNVFELQNVNNYLEFHLKNGGNIFLKTAFTRSELKKIVEKMWEFGHEKKEAPHRLVR